MISGSILTTDWLTFPNFGQSCELASKGLNVTSPFAGGWASSGARHEERMKDEGEEAAEG